MLHRPLAYLLNAVAAMSQLESVRQDMAKLLTRWPSTASRP
jgi:hypothetical protein